MGGGQLQNRRALVTGGGRGIGRGIVDRFLEAGATVAVAQRSPLDDDLAAAEAVVHVPADLTDATTLVDVVDTAAEELGGLDILVNNAGIMFERTVTAITIAEWETMTAVNLRAPLFLAQAAVRHMRQRGGAIVNIGSVEGISANPDHAAYAASKAGVHGMTRAMAIDLGPDGIRCNAIAPGWISSDLSEQYLDSTADPEAARRALLGLHPVGRLGRPTDVGDLAVFLASDHAEFLTGEVIVLDGGRTARLPTPE
jgi:meso-butanediol dehydrogenase/(S,S)-butanediol dehydrogenase/diacetyl reductase